MATNSVARVPEAAAMVVLMATAAFSWLTPFMMALVEPGLKPGWVRGREYVYL